MKKPRIVYTRFTRFKREIAFARSAVRCLAWLCCALALAGACVTSTTQTETETETKTETKTDRHGKWALWSGPHRLRGANIYQRRVYPGLDDPASMGPGPVGPPYTRDDFRRLAAHGANFVNISHPGIFTETPPYGPDPAAQSNLDRLLDLAERAGLRAVIAFRTGPGRSEFSIQREGDWFPRRLILDDVWTCPDARAAWITMWRYTARRYRDRATVIGYDLMVEPNACHIVPYGPFWDPATFHAWYAGTSWDWNRLHPRIAAAVRAEDPFTPILIEPDGYGGLAWLPFLTRSGAVHTVYAVHQFEPHAYTHQEAEADPPIPYPGDGEDGPFDAAWIESLFATADDFAAKHGAPLAVTELGVKRWAPGAAAFLRDQLAALERRGIHHAVWLWECSIPEYTRSHTPFNFRLGPDPANVEDAAENELLDVIRAAWSLNAAPVAPCPARAGQGKRTPDARTPTP